jgi:putative PIG3 family NAD(P)H quinone oxidoreductase
MKSIQIDGDRLTWSDCEIHGPGPGEVGIAVRASAVNRADLLQRRGAYPPPPGASKVLGLECAGVVEAVGEGVAGLRPGDEVCALLAGGGYAEKAVAPAPQVLPVPQGLSLVEAAALPEVFATAYLNLYMEAGLSAGEKALLHAGASGVGTAAIQLCRDFGNPCYVTAGSEDKISRCIALGACGGSNRHRERFADKVAEWTGGKGFDVILDPVGGIYLADNLQSLGLEGRLVLIGAMGGTQASISIGVLMAKRLKLVGSTLRARSVARKAEILAALRQRVWPRIAAGAIRPVIAAVIAMDCADEAHRFIAGNQTFGKVVLEIP